ncbi:hypothetical protein HK100_006217 [Physocladia obscura]|uniref:Uncharacterized protein n=1 Tax=Physocladia obscura TaxID=109957 RepID=A0AAD5XF88_9FUNG|nr:hypothetical protein HK100_006217 [Physocladia obscura]
MEQHQLLHQQQRKQNELLLQREILIGIAKSEQPEPLSAPAAVRAEISLLKMCGAVQNNPLFKRDCPTKRHSAPLLSTPPYLDNYSPSIAVQPSSSASFNYPVPEAEPPQPSMTRSYTWSGNNNRTNNSNIIPPSKFIVASTLNRISSSRSFDNNSSCLNLDLAIAASPPSISIKFNAFKLADRELRAAQIIKTRFLKSDSAVSVSPADAIQIHSPIPEEISPPIAPADSKTLLRKEINGIAGNIKEYFVPLKLQHETDESSTSLINNSNFESCSGLNTVQNAASIGNEDSILENLPKFMDDECNEVSFIFATTTTAVATTANRSTDASTAFYLTSQSPKNNIAESRRNYVQNVDNLPKIFSSNADGSILVEVISTESMIFENFDDDRNIFLRNIKCDISDNAENNSFFSHSLDIKNDRRYSKMAKQATATTNSEYKQISIENILLNVDETIAAKSTDISDVDQLDFGLSNCRNNLSTPSIVADNSCLHNSSSEILTKETRNSLIAQNCATTENDNESRFGYQKFPSINDVSDIQIKLLISGDKFTNHSALENNGDNDSRNHSFLVGDNEKLLPSIDVSDIQIHASLNDLNLNSSLIDSLTESTNKYNVNDVIHDCNAGLKSVRDFDDKSEDEKLPSIEVSDIPTKHPVVGSSISSSSFTDRPIINVEEKLSLCNSEVKIENDGIRRVLSKINISDIEIEQTCRINDNMNASSIVIENSFDVPTANAIENHGKNECSNNILIKHEVEEQTIVSFPQSVGNISGIIASSNLFMEDDSVALGNDNKLFNLDVSDIQQIEKRDDNSSSILIENFCSDEGSGEIDSNNSKISCNISELAAADSNYALHALTSNSSSLDDGGEKFSSIDISDIKIKELNDDGGSIGNLSSVAAEASTILQDSINSKALEIHNNEFMQQQSSFSTNTMVGDNLGMQRIIVDHDIKNTVAENIEIKNSSKSAWDETNNGKCEYSSSAANMFGGLQIGNFSPSLPTSDDEELDEKEEFNNGGVGNLFEDFNGGIISFNEFASAIQSKQTSNNLDFLSPIIAPRKVDKNSNEFTGNISNTSIGGEYGVDNSQSRLEEDAAVTSFDIFSAEGGSFDIGDSRSILAEAIGGSFFGGKAVDNNLPIPAIFDEDGYKPIIEAPMNHSDDEIDLNDHGSWDKKANPTNYDHDLIPPINLDFETNWFDFKSEFEPAYNVATTSKNVLFDLKIPEFMAKFIDIANKPAELKSSNSSTHDKECHQSPTVKNSRNMNSRESPLELTQFPDPIIELDKLNPITLKSIDEAEHSFFEIDSSFGDLSDILPGESEPANLSNEDIIVGVKASLDDDDEYGNYDDGVGRRLRNSGFNFWGNGSFSSVFSDGTSYENNTKKKEGNGEKKTVNWGLARFGKLQQIRVFDPEAPVKPPREAENKNGILFFRLDSVDQLNVPNNQSTYNHITIDPAVTKSTPIEFECKFKIPPKTLTQAPPQLDAILRIAPLISSNSSPNRSNNKKASKPTAPKIAQSRSIALPQIFRTSSSSSNRKAADVADDLIRTETKPSSMPLFPTPPLPLGGISTRIVLLENVRKIGEMADAQVCEHVWNVDFVGGGGAVVAMKLFIRVVGMLKGIENNETPDNFSEALYGVEINKLHNSVQMTGHMTQIGGDLNSWKRRYYELVGCNLLAYEDNKEKIPIMKLDLSLARTIRSSKIVAIISPKSERSCISSIFNINELNENERIKKNDGSYPISSSPTEYLDAENGRKIANIFEIEMKDGEIIQFSTLGETNNVDGEDCTEGLLDKWWEICDNMDSDDESSDVEENDQQLGSYQLGFLAEMEEMDNTFEDIQVQNQKKRARSAHPEVLNDSSSIVSKMWLRALTYSAVVIGDEIVPVWLKHY